MPCTRQPEPREGQAGPAGWRRGGREPATEIGGATGTAQIGGRRETPGWFAAQVVAVKQKYGLSVNPAERDALASMLASDPQSRMREIRTSGSEGRGWKRAYGHRATS